MDDSRIEDPVTDSAGVTIAAEVASDDVIDPLLECDCGALEPLGRAGSGSRARGGMGAEVDLDRTGMGGWLISSADSMAEASSSSSRPKVGDSDRACNGA